MNLSVYQQLISWYLENKRPLPWRETKTPYRVWLSEIMLQQTRVSQGLPYFEAFTSKYPTVDKLAKAKEEDVLRLWQGLGYYSRARNLHKCAKIVTQEYQACFPKSAKELQKLPGVGSYTAAAIASICFGEKIAVVDGNVLRVISRLFAINDDLRDGKTQKHIAKLAQELLVGKDAENYNQGLMELGALICTPKNPQCDRCPLSENCLSYKTGKTASIPFKSPAKKAKRRDIKYKLLINEENKFIVEQRQSEKDIWCGLYQFPEFNPGNVNEENINYGPKTNSDELKKHQLYLQSIYASIEVHQLKNAKLLSNQRMVNLKEFESLPKPQLIVNCSAILEKELGA